MAKELKNVIADRRLWLTADRQRVVEEGSSDAAILYATPGTVILGEAVKRFKIKALKKVEDKAVKPDEDKGGDSKGGLTVTRSATRIGKRPVAKAK